MLVVTIELWPRGFETNKQTIGKMYIANDGTGTLTQGNYDAIIKKRGTNTTWKIGRIEGFPRKRLGPWYLLYRLLLSCGMDKQ